jgi:hypothetical protein
MCIGHIGMQETSVGSYLILCWNCFEHCSQVRVPLNKMRVAFEVLAVVTRLKTVLLYKFTIVALQALPACCHLLGYSVV